MMLTERQKQILTGTILEYISKAEPISSQLLEERYEFPVSSATIRSELQGLTEKGFLVQPHISSGRVPTDKGYRFFVDTILEASENGHEDIFAMRKEAHDYLEDVQVAIQQLARATSSLTYAYLIGHRIVWKEGWEKILHEPEFTEVVLIKNLTRFLQDLEGAIRNLRARRITIYIGRENPFSHIQDFSVILSECTFIEGQRGVVALVGPKRMAYEKNIALMNSLHTSFI